MIIHFRNNTGTKRAVVGRRNEFTLRLVPDNVYCSGIAYIVNGNITLSVGGFYSRLRSIGGTNMGPGLLISSHTRVLVPCRVLLSACRRRELNGGTFNSAGDNVTPFFDSGCTGVNVRYGRLFSSRVLGTGLRGVIALGGLVLRRICRGPLLSRSRLCGAYVRCGGGVTPCVYSARTFVHSTLGRNGGVLLRNRLNALGSPSFNVCPVIASSSALTNCNTIKTKVPPCLVDRMMTIAGTCSSTMNTNRFISRVLSRSRTRRLEVRNNSGNRFNTAANEPEEVN